MGGVAARDNERRDVEAQQVFRLGTGGRITVEQCARDAGDDKLVLIDVKLCVGVRESAVMTNHGRPGPAPWIGAERLSLTSYQCHHLGKAVLLHEHQVFREALMAGVRLHFIMAEESPHWSQMLRDRNLTSHTYNAGVADQMIERLLRDYVPAFRAALERLRAAG